MDLSSCVKPSSRLNDVGVVQVVDIHLGIKCRGESFGICLVFDDHPRSSLVRCREEMITGFRSIHHGPGRRPMVVAREVGSLAKEQWAPFAGRAFDAEYVQSSSQMG